MQLANFNNLWTLLAFYLVNDLLRCCNPLDYHHYLSIGKLQQPSAVNAIHGTPYFRAGTFENVGYYFGSSNNVLSSYHRLTRLPCSAIAASMTASILIPAVWPFSSTWTGGSKSVLCGGLGRITFPWANVCSKAMRQ